MMLSLLSSYLDVVPEEFLPCVDLDHLDAHDDVLNNLQASVRALSHLLSKDSKHSTQHD